MSRWLRWYAGTSEDGKIRFVARNASVTVATVIGVWAALLEDASHDDHRGVVVKNEDYFAAILDLEDGVMEQILSAMEQVEMISVGHGAITIVHWKERQFETDAKDPTNAERQRRHREKRKQHAPVTERNGSVTVETRPDTDTETETEQKESPLPPVPGDQDDMPRHVKPIANWGSAFAPPDDGIVIVAGQVQITGTVRAEWLGRFGNDENALSLALLQVSGQVQPNSRAHSLGAQVNRHLAKLVQERNDRDRRYREACEANKTARSPADKKPPGDFASQRIERARSFAAKLNLGTAA